MNRKERLLRSLSAAQFALWELHIYLDTHPSDMEAAALHAKYEKKTDQLRQEYESAFGPLTPAAGEGVCWLQDPWPWDRNGDDD